MLNKAQIFELINLHIIIFFYIYRKIKTSKQVEDFIMSLPYYSSLNSQMAEYLKQVKMQEYNDTYQQAQLDIVLEGQRNLASQAEIMNRLKELQTQIANQASTSLIPLSKTNANAPEAAKQIEEEKFPTLTAAEYENKARTARKVPTMEELNYPEIVIDKYTPNNAIYDLKEIIIGDPNLSTQFKNELKKKLNNILKNPPKKEVRLKLPEEIINQIKFAPRGSSMIAKNKTLKQLKENANKKSEQKSMQAEDMATQYQNRYKNVVEKAKQKKEQKSMQAEDMATQYLNSKDPINVMMRVLKLKQNAKGKFTRINK